MRITIVSNFLFVKIILFSLLSLLFINYANAQQLKTNAIVSPGCGDVTGFGANLNVNRFEPNSTVGWKLVNPETQTTSDFGYFSTNSTGGFSESVYIEEGELVEGKYKIQFFDDADTDGNPDPGKNEFIVSILVPCKEK
jgi:hypothetical protein